MTIAVIRYGAAWITAGIAEYLGWHDHPFLCIACSVVFAILAPPLTAWKIGGNRG